jgi:hypothetical protein
MSDDQPRHGAASSDTDYTLSIDEAAALYERAGLPRTLRSIQRYCAKAHLDARRIESKRQLFTATWFWRGLFGGGLRYERGSL